MYRSLLLAVLSAGTICLSIGPIVAADSEIAQTLAKYADRNGTLDLARIQNDYNAAQALKINREVAPKVANRQIASVDPGPPVQTKAKFPTKAAGTGGERDTSPTATPKSSFTFLLRDSFSDIWLFDSPTPVKKAKGAEFSWSRDSVMHDSKWSVHGVAAVVYGLAGDYSRDSRSVSVVGASVAAYAKMDRETHSKLTTKNVDTLTSGGTAEIGFDNLFGGLQYFRASAGAVSDNIKDTTTINSVFEWLPVYSELCIDYPCSLPGTPIIFNFQPEVKVQYDNTAGTKVPLAFSLRNEALRVGPEATLVFKPFGLNLGVLNNVSGKVTYHWDVETYSGRHFDWFSSSVSYNIDPNGFIALTLSYQKGYTEEAGQRTDLLKLAFTAKY